MYGINNSEKKKRITLSRNTLIERFYHLHICFAEKISNSNARIDAPNSFSWRRNEFLCFAVGDEALHLSQFNIFFFGCCFFFIYLLLWSAASSLRVYVTLVVWLYFVVVHLLFSSSLICMVGGVGKLEQLFFTIRYDIIMEIHYLTADEFTFCILTSLDIIWFC